MIAGILVTILSSMKFTIIIIDSAELESSDKYDIEFDDITTHDCEEADSCTLRCCDAHETMPYHPNVDLNQTKKQQGSQSRSFCSVWFKHHEWLTFCTTQNKAFCFYCRSANAKGLLTSQLKYESAFIKKGFDNWKKAKQKFNQHQKSVAHRESLSKHKLLSQPVQLSNQIKKDQEKHRVGLMKQLSSLKFLTHQGLAIRGHEERQGNLPQLLQCRAEDVPALSAWLSSGKYQSHEVVNELMAEMSHQLLRTLLSEVREAKYFSLIADETRDASCHEQLSISARWVDKQFDIHEDFIGLMEVEKTDAATLTSVISDCLIRCNLHLSNCVGQAYDGASNMSGRLTGVAARIINEYPKILYVHCLAHCLNLCLQDCGRNCDSVRDSLSLVSELNALIRASPQRLAVFEKVKSEMAPEAPGLKPLCVTRWTVRSGALNAVIKNYITIGSTLEEIEKTSNSEASHKAPGLLSLMDKFSTYFGLNLSYQIFAVTEQLSRTLQAKDITAQGALTAVTKTVSFLRRQRSDDAFNDFYKRIKDEAKDLTDDPVLPRQRRLPKRYDGGGASHTFSTPNEYFRKQYFEVHDLLIAELDRRFQHNAFVVLKDIENLLLDASNGKVAHPSAQLQQLYGEAISFDRLLIQLSMLPDLVKMVNEVQHSRITKVTNISTICELFNTCDMSKVMLGEVFELVRLYLTIPMTSATAERTFSTLRRLKNYMRTTMTQKRLNHVVLLHTHKNRTDCLNLRDIAEKFISVNERRSSYFGHF